MMIYVENIDAARRTKARKLENNIFKEGRKINERVFFFFCPLVVLVPIEDLGFRIIRKCHR